MMTLIKQLLTALIRKSGEKLQPAPNTLIMYVAATMLPMQMNALQKPLAL